MAFNKKEFYFQLLVSAIFAWGIYELYSRAVAKFDEGRLAAASSESATSALGVESRASMLPFYSSFCMPYTPSMSNFEFKVLARKVASVYISIFYKSLRYYFCSLITPSYCPSVTVACAGLQSTTFAWLNIWYMRHLVQRPYISGRKNKDLGDPLNDADMLTTRVYIWSSVLLAVSPVAGGNGHFTHQALLMNVLCGAIVVALVWPQRLLFTGLKHSLRELASRKNGVDDGSTGSGERVAEDEATMLVEKMMRVEDAPTLFALQQEMLKRSDLAEIERARWTPRGSDVGGSSVESARCFSTLLLYLSMRITGLKTHLAGRIVLRLSRLLVGSAVTYGVGWVVFKMSFVAVRYPETAFVWVCVAVLSAVVSEMLRVRWIREYTMKALERHRSQTSHHQSAQYASPVERRSSSSLLASSSSSSSSSSNNKIGDTISAASDGRKSSMSSVGTAIELVEIKAKAEASTVHDKPERSSNDAGEGWESATNPIFLAAERP